MEGRLDRPEEGPQRLRFPRAIPGRFGRTPRPPPPPIASIASNLSARSRREGASGQSNSSLPCRTSRKPTKDRRTSSPRPQQRVSASGPTTANRPVRQPSRTPIMIPIRLQPRRHQRGVRPPAVPLPHGPGRPRSSPSAPGLGSSASYGDFSISGHRSRRHRRRRRSRPRLRPNPENLSLSLPKRTQGQVSHPVAQGGEDGPGGLLTLLAERSGGWGCDTDSSGNRQQARRGSRSEHQRSWANSARRVRPSTRSR